MLWLPYRSFYFPIDLPWSQLDPYENEAYDEVEVYIGDTKDADVNNSKYLGFIMDRHIPKKDDVSFISKIKTNAKSDKSTEIEEFNMYLYLVLDNRNPRLHTLVKDNLTFYEILERNKSVKKIYSTNKYNLVFKISIDSPNLNYNHFLKGFYSYIYPDWMINSDLMKKEFVTYYKNEKYYNPYYYVLRKTDNYYKSLILSLDIRDEETQRKMIFTEFLQPVQDLKTLIHNT